MRAPRRTRPAPIAARIVLAGTVALVSAAYNLDLNLERRGHRG